MKFKETIKRIFRINSNVIKGEIDEIKHLSPTEEDYAQGEQLSSIAIAAMASMGLPYTVFTKSIISKVFAYGIRDLKDGIQDNRKLILNRVIAEVRKEKQEQDERNTTTLD